MPGSTVPVVPGFKLWQVEYEDNDRYEYTWVHIPDECEDNMSRRTWLRLAEAVPGSSSITHMTCATCQTHAFQCRSADHEQPQPQPYPILADMLTADELVRSQREIDARRSQEALDHMRTWLDARAAAVRPAPAQTWSEDHGTVNWERDLISGRFERADRMPERPEGLIGRYNPLERTLTYNWDDIVAAPVHRDVPTARWTCEWGCVCPTQDCTCHRYHDMEYLDGYRNVHTEP